MNGVLWGMAPMSWSLAGLLTDWRSSFLKGSFLPDLLIPLTLVTLILFVWAAFFRKRRSRRRYHRHHRTFPAPPEKSVDDPPLNQNGADQPHKTSFAQRRRKRRSRNPANPTLADSGGLPPLRATEAKPPAPPA